MTDVTLPAPRGFKEKLLGFFGAAPKSVVQGAIAVGVDAAKAEIQEVTLERFVEILQLSQGYTVSRAGITISPEIAMHSATVATCQRVLGESVASVPCILYRRARDGSRERATDHPLYTVLHDKVTSWLTSFEYFDGQMVNLAMQGNAYAYVDRDSRGRVIGLTPLNPTGVQIEQARDWSPVYTVTMPDNTRTRLPRARLHHVRGPMPKGYLGRSMIAMARDAIGVSIAAERFGAEFFANGARPSSVLKHGGSLSEGAIKRLKEQFQAAHTGDGNRGGTLVLEEGMEWVATSIKPDEAQFLETRKFQRSEIAGMFRVPAHLINDLERATFSNIEHQSLDFVIHSLRPWLKRWEQAIKRDLLNGPGEQDYFVEFLLDDLLRGDFKTRMEGYALQIQNGIASPDECRARENMPKRPDGEGGAYWRPGNMYPPNSEQPAGQTD